MPLKRREPKLRIFSIFFFLPLLFLNCDGDEKFVFPYQPIDVVLHIPTDMATVGFYDSKIIEHAGVGGLLIFRLSEYEFMAFDLACTYDIPEICTVAEYKDSQIIWECPCCKSQFTIDNYGCYVSKAPARWALKRYPVIVDGDFLYIRN